jgi:hypothetical protein
MLLATYSMATYYSGIFPFYDFHPLHILVLTLYLFLFQAVIPFFLAFLNSIAYPLLTHC